VSKSIDRRCTSQFVVGLKRRRALGRPFKTCLTALPLSRRCSDDPPSSAVGDISDLRDIALASRKSLAS
jgi:hypothetical protein